jgi:general secretion pathway protein G
MNMNTNHGNRRPLRHVRRAFTLLEIIVVVTIIALLAALVAPRLLDNIWKTKQKIAQAEVASIAQQVGLYLADHGMSRPPQDLDLDALVPNYLRAKDILDPWGNKYMIVVPGVHNPDFDILSYGGDGVPGGEGEDADVWN